MIEYNSLAILIAIFENTTVEKAFYLLEKRLNNKNIRYSLSDSEKQSIYNLVNEGFTFAEVGRLMGIKFNTIRHAYIKEREKREGLKHEKTRDKRKHTKTIN